MTRAEKLDALRRYIVEGRSDAMIDGAGGTVTFDCEAGRVTASIVDLESARSAIDVEKQNEQLRQTKGESEESGTP